MSVTGADAEDCADMHHRREHDPAGLSNLLTAPLSVGPIAPSSSKSRAPTMPNPYRGPRRQLPSRLLRITRRIE